MMRRMLFATVVTLLVSPTLARADESVSGPWLADLGHGVVISMDILADGHWWSTTVQDNKVVAELAGSYQQTKTNGVSGKLVFTPSSSKTSEEHGPAKVEEDKYTLSNGAKTLRLVTNNEVMQFEKQPYAD